MKKCFIILCFFITVFAYSAPQKNKKVITFKADIASYQEVKAKNVFKGQGNAYLEIDDYKIYCEEIEIHFFKDNKGEDQIEKALFNKTIRIFNKIDQFIYLNFYEKFLFFAIIDLFSKIQKS